MEQEFQLSADQLSKVNESIKRLTGYVAVLDKLRAAKVDVDDIEEARIASLERLTALKDSFSPQSSRRKRMVK